MELPKFLTSEKNIIVPVGRHDIDGVARKLKDVSFQLHLLCDIPIFTFHFKKPWDVEVVPVNFRLFNTWPESKNLIINLQLSDTNNGSTTSVRQIVLNEEDTEVILEARSEQRKMTSRQIDSIVDLIYSDYFGFTELRETSKKEAGKS